MAQTAGFQAGTESNAVQVSYAQEVVWGVPPAVAFQAIRLTAESLSSTKKRDRPAEFNLNGEVQAAVTTQVTAGGDLTFALSYGTFDDLLAGALNSDWAAANTVTGSNGDLTMTTAAGGTAQLQSTTAGKFASFPGSGFWLRTRGFTNPANNGLFYVTGNSGAILQITTLAVQTVQETPAGAVVTIGQRGSLVNGAAFRSYTVQKQFSSALYLVYPGSYVSAFMLSGGTGKFLNGTFTLISQTEKSATANGSTGAVLAAPTGRVHDPVGNFIGVFLDGALLSSVVDSFTLTGTSTGAAGEYGMGSAASQGVIAGLLEVKGSLKVYFRDFALYQRFLSEQAGLLQFVTRDADGNGYVISVLSATLMNPKIVAGGQNTAVMATFDIEGNPVPGSKGTISIVRL